MKICGRNLEINILKTVEANVMQVDEETQEVILSTKYGNRTLSFSYFLEKPKKDDVLLLIADDFQNPKNLIAIRKFHQNKAVSNFSSILDDVENMSSEEFKATLFKATLLKAKIINADGELTDKYKSTTN
jgi:hypothetical protein